jgi:hypothetical protein
MNIVFTEKISPDVIAERTVCNDSRKENQTPAGCGGRFNTGEIVCGVAELTPSFHSFVGNLPGSV